jgi:hypothetical protein
MCFAASNDFKTAFCGECNLMEYVLKPPDNCSFNQITGTANQVTAANPRMKKSSDRANTHILLRVLLGEGLLEGGDSPLHSGIWLGLRASRIENNSYLLVRGKVYTTTNRS